MKVDAKELICGVRPADLKKLLRAQDRFDTPTAMRHWDLEEPEITATLAALQQQGWIEFCGNMDGIDWWQPAQRGRRLAATALLKRIAVDQAQAILVRLIEEARAINAEPQSSRRLTRILLFGSLLTATAEDTVGDIDVVIHHDRRNLPEAEWHALEEHERAEAPDNVRANFSSLLYWPDARLKRRLAKISPYLSIHQEYDLIGNLYAEVYAYDLARELETPPDSTRRTHGGTLEPDNERPNENAAYSRTPRDWPAAPTRAIVKNIDNEEMRLAQHLWMNGRSVKDIAKSIGVEADSVQSYLASRRVQPVVMKRAGIFASLRTTVLAVLPSERDFSVQVILRQHHAQMTIETNLVGAKQRVARHWRVGRKARISQAPIELAGILQNIDRAAWGWYEVMRSKLRELNLEVQTQCSKDDAAHADKGANRIDIRPLKQPLLALLDHCWKKPREQYGGYSQRLSVNLAPEPIVTYLQEAKGESRHISGAGAEAVIEVAQSIYRKCELALLGTSFSVYTTGETLELPEC